MVLLRLLHIVFGALWVGMMFFMVFFVIPNPAADAVGPEGGKLTTARQRRRLMVIMPILALITLVSGMMLFDRLAGGQHGAMMATPMGRALAFGAASSIIAFLLGLIVMRPAMMKVATATPEEWATRSAELQRLQMRASVTGNIVAVLLLLALGAMAVARYV